MCSTLKANDRRGSLHITYPNIDSNNGDDKKELSKQIHFLFCEICLWCASHLPSKSLSVVIKCPNCYNNKIKWMPISNKLETTRRLQTIEQGNHIIAVYANKDEKFNEAFEFLKDGLQRNEAIVIITSDLSKTEIRARMRNKWKIDVAELESRDDIMIRSTEEIYFPAGIPNIQRTVALWSTLAENCLSRGKQGIRIFGDMAAFFKKGFIKELCDYESCLEQRFSFPAIGICAYDSKDIDNNMTLEQTKQLQQYHNPVWMENYQ
jgi:predicted  nucleic acid-binding Zn-ribbon protein